MDLLFYIIAGIFVEFGSNITLEGIKNLYYRLKRRININKSFIDIFLEYVISEIPEEHERIKKLLKKEKSKFLEYFSIRHLKKPSDFLNDLKSDKFYMKKAEECHNLLNINPNSLEAILRNTFKDLRGKIIETLPDDILKRKEFENLEGIYEILNKMYFDVDRIFTFEQRYLNSLYRRYCEHTFLGISSPIRAATCEFNQLYVKPKFELVSDYVSGGILVTYDSVMSSSDNYPEYDKKMRELGPKPYDIESDIIVELRIDLGTKLNKFELKFYTDPDYSVMVTERILSSIYLKIESLFNLKKIVLLGDPGIGKTMFLKFLVLLNSMNEVPLEYTRIINNRYPFLVELREFAKKRVKNGSGYNLFTFILESVMDIISTNEQKNVQDLLRCLIEQEANCVILFDGYDEILDPILQGEIKGLIESFINNYPENQYIITSRFAGYENIKFDESEYLHIKLKEFSTTQKNEFIHHIFEIFRQPQKADEVIRLLQVNETINELADNPLMLTIITLMTLKGYNISQDSQWELLKFCTDTFLEDWILFKRLELRQNRRLLQKLAYYLHSSSITSKNQAISIKKKDLTKKLKEFLLELSRYEDLNFDNIDREVEHTLKYIKDTNGLLIEQPNGNFRFPYLIIQEYFAASYIETSFADTIDIYNEIIDKILLAKWYGVLKFLFGILNENEVKLNKLIHLIFSYSQNSTQFRVHERLEYLNFILSIIRQRIRIDKVFKKEILIRFLNEGGDFLKKTSRFYTYGILKNLLVFKDNLAIFQDFIEKSIEKNDNSVLINTINILILLESLLSYIDKELLIRNHLNFKKLIRLGDKIRSKSIQKIYYIVLLLFVPTNLKEINLNNYIKLINLAFEEIQVNQGKFELFKKDGSMIYKDALMLLNLRIPIAILNYFVIFFNNLSYDTQEFKSLFNHIHIQKLDKFLDLEINLESLTVFPRELRCLTYKWMHKDEQIINKLRLKIENVGDLQSTQTVAVLERFLGKISDVIKIYEALGLF